MTDDDDFVSAGDCCVCGEEVEECYETKCCECQKIMHPTCGTWNGFGYDCYNCKEPAEE